MNILPTGNAVADVLRKVNAIVATAEKGVRLLFKYVAIIAIVAIAVTINLNILFRYALSNSLPWAEGFSTLLNTWVAFVGGAVALYVGDHVNIEYVPQKLPIEAQRIISVIINLLTLILGISMLWWGSQLALDQAGHQFIYFNISLFWLRIPLALCGAYLVLETGRRLLVTLIEGLENGDSRPLLVFAISAVFLSLFYWMSVVFPDNNILGLGVIFAILIGLIIFGMPIAFAMTLSVLLFLLLFTNALEILQPLLVIQEMGQSLEGFSILAIPMFIYAGWIMSIAGITSRIVDFANLLVGRMRAGLSHVNVVSSMLFAGISGSAVADTAAIGSILIPAMKDEGYSRGYASAVTCSSATIGPIIPPSIIMIIYGITVAEVGIAELFLAGVVPGILLGVALIVMTYLYYGYWDDWEQVPEIEATDPPTGREALKVVRDAMLAMIMPLIIIGGILSGVFTATEAGAVAVGYALLIGGVVYREISLQNFIEASYESATISGVTLFIIAAAMPITQVMAIQGVTDQFADLLLGVSQSPTLVLLMIVAFLSLMALFIEEIANIILWAPVFSPLAISVAIDPLHFAIVMILTLAIGMITPPLGVTLFVAAPIADTNIENITKNLVPFFIAELTVLLLIILFPEVSLALPRALGY